MSTRPLAAALLAELMALPDDELRPFAERLAPLVERLQPGPAQPSPFMTAGEAAELLRCRKRRIYELVADGRLTRQGDGRRLLVMRSEVVQLASGQLTTC